MGKAHAPMLAKLFVGMLFQDVALADQCAGRLSGIYGPVDMRSDVLPWNHSDYYRVEMGADLLRQFFFFERLIDPGDLASIKQYTLRLEQELARSGTAGMYRTVNLDPGYLTEAKVVLATTKDFPHRVYIGGGIYAEATLHYSKLHSAYLAVEHTYPDFRDLRCKELFGRARVALRARLQDK